MRSTSSTGSAVNTVNKVNTVQTLSLPPQADESNVDDFSEIIYERKSDRNSMSGFLPPPGGGVYLTALTVLTRLTALTADRIDHVDMLTAKCQ